MSKALAEELLLLLRVDLPELDSRQLQGNEERKQQV